MRMISNMSRSKRLVWTGAFALGVVVLSGCDELLEVELPDAVTSDALNDPSTASVQVNSVMASVECGYSSFAIDAARRPATCPGANSRCWRSDAP